MKKLLSALILLAIGFALGKVDVPNAIANEQKFTLESCVAQLDKFAVRKSARGWAFWFVNKELSGGLNVKMSQVGPEQAHHGAHTHDESEVFISCKETQSLFCAMNP